ncbi:uncharacterized protein LOC123878457 [Maniola jurtina]|uniref:uncharacterized protein LOC123878457 n=1 Tax=Maniola jurtina TaxID=191418 RepID=UPI001E68D890|nr:uncharacterized protein LOC123878457 [Maniola jurtina]
MIVQEEPWYISVCEELDEFCQKVDEKIDKELQQLKACEKRNELEYKLTQERKHNAELKEQLAELNRRLDELERTCTSFSKLTITENDQQRLDNTKEAYELAKELTGIRFDFSAPANKMRGYIKNESRRILLPFDTDIDPDALWELMKTASDPAWFNKENQHPN